MGKTQHAIEIQAIVKTSLEGLDSTVKRLQDELKSGNLQIDLTKGVGKDLSKLISNFETSFSKIKQMTPDDKLQIIDSKEFQKEGNNIIKTIMEIQRITEDLGTKNLLDAKKIFPNSFDGRITELLEKINSVGSTLETLGKRQAKLDQLNAELSGLTAQLNGLEEAANNIDAIRQKANDADTALEQSKKKVEELRASLVKDIELKFSTDKIEEAKKARKELEDLEKRGVSKSFTGKAIYQGRGIGDWKNYAKDGTSKQKAQAEAAIKLLQTYNKINGSLSSQNKFLSDNEKIQKLINSPEGINNDKFLKVAAGMVGQSDSVKRVLEERARATEQVSLAQADLTRAENAGANAQKIKQDITQKTQAMKELEVVIKSLKDNSSLTELTAKFNEITGLNLAPTKENLVVMAAKLKEIDGKAYENLKTALSSLNIVLPETREQIQGVRKGFEDAEGRVNQFDDRLRETEQLKNRIKYFFGLTNSIQLFKRAVTKAMNTVKELDKTMTEAAVVTDFTVGDMWDKLPTYSTQAQKLGVSINSMYQATTLYYQQGLKTNEAMALGVETMKMGRIAAMDSTEATKAMTAALRGFNMELNETSATRVNDVYSQLAAVTAADTNQIATAMEKTASIAASANMEFETTAALLAQIIETTQEAPETAGTALKTIIARFSEVKSLRDQGQTTGKDSEGEDIDVNKIQTALRTVGISMDGFFAGTEGLDSILLKLAEKWEGLDFETQRYIATMAAGSRQQSRFIAMMSDYARTTELVGEAQNSAGASQRQFEKTLDSMDTKIQKLGNAWNEFLMGLANNEILKFAIDSLTFIVEGINKITESISGGNGLIKSITNLVGIVGALKLGKNLINGSFGSLLGESIIDKKTTYGTDGTAIIEEHIIKNPQQQGIKAGQKIGTGLIAGIKRVAGQSGVSRLKSFFQVPVIRQPTKDELDKIGKTLSPMLQNKGIQIPVNGIQNIDQAKQAINQYNQSIDQTKESFITFESVCKNAGVSLHQTAFDFRATGQAIQGAGVALGLFSVLFEKVGWEEEAEVVSTLSSALMLLGTGLTVMPTLLRLTGAALEKFGVTAATVGAQAAWLIAIVAVFATVIAIISTFIEVLEKADDATQLEEMSNQLEELSSAADEAKNKLDELSSAKQGLEDLANTFDSLVKGSQEWKQALIENNQKVLELLSTYPKLIDYVSRGLYGELTIDTQGWNELIDNQQRAYTSALSARTAKVIQIDKKKLEIEIEKTLDEEVGFAFELEYAEFMKEIAADPDSYGALTQIIAKNAASTESVERKQTAGLTYEQFYRFAAMAADKGYSATIGISEAQAKEILEQMAPGREFESAEITSFIGHINGLGENFDKLAESAWQVREAELARVDAIAANVAQTSSIVSESIYGATAQDIAANTFFDYEDRIEERVASYMPYLKDDLDSESSEMILNRYAQDNNMEIAQVKKLIEDGEVSLTEIANSVAASVVNEKMVGAMETAVKLLENLPTNQARQLSAILSRKGAGFTRSDLNKMSGLDEGEIKQYLSDQGITTDDQAIALGYQGLDHMVTSILNSMGKASLAFSEFDATLRQLDIKKLDLDNTLTAESATVLNDKINKVIIASGTSAASELLTEFDKLALQSGDPEKFMSAINSINWSSISEIESLSETLDALGLASKFSKGQIDDLEQNIIKVAQATREYDLNSLAERLKKNAELIEEISDRVEHERAFSQEQYNELTGKYGISKEQFVVGMSGEWIYIGDSLSLLEEAVRANTQALIEDTKNSLDYKVSRAQNWSGVELTGNALELATGSKNFTKVVDDREQYYDRDKNVIKGTNYSLDEYYIDPTNGNIMPLGYNESINEYKPIDNIYGQIHERDQIYAREDAVSALTRVGYGVDRLEELSDDQILQLLREEYAAYGTEAGRNAIYSEQAAFASNEVVLNYMSKLSGGSFVSDILLKHGGFSNTAELDSAISGLLATTEGAAGQFGIWNNELKQTGEWSVEAERRLKNLAINTAKAQKAAKGLSDALADNLENFKKGKAGGQDYVLALENITKAAREAFGDEVTGEFVDANRELFIQLAEGGAGAEEAYKKIQNELVKTALHVGHTGDEIRQIIENSGGNVEIGVAFPLDEILEKFRILGYNAEETAKILRSMGYEVEFHWKYMWQDDLTGMLSESPPSGVNSSWSPVRIFTGVGTKVSNGSTFSGGSSGGGGGGEWENPYDKLHNTLEEINELMRERERIERRYQRLVERGEATATKLIEERQRQLENITKEIEKQKELQAGREAQIAELLAENPEMAKYVYTEEVNGEQVIRIDWEAINAIKDTDQGEKISEFYEKLQEWLDELQEIGVTIEDLYDQVYEISQEGKDEYLSFEDMVKEAIIAERQDQIDKLSEINDSINDTNSKLIEAMQSELDKQRQERENEKTEEELSDKQRRLAYLQQDTSGANALEILQLQKEIDEATEDYTDTLIDQKISELQEQNDMAAEQRQQQIDIMQAQLDQYVASGAIWEEVSKLMEEGLDENNGLIRGSRLEELLKSSIGFEGLSAIAKMNWLEDINTQIAQLLAWLTNLAIMGEVGQEITFTTPDGQSLSGIVNEDGTVTVDGKTYKISLGSDGRYHGEEIIPEAPPQEPPQEPPTSQWPEEYPKPSEVAEYLMIGSEGKAVKGLQYALKELEFYDGVVDGVFGPQTERALKEFQRNSGIGIDGILGPESKEAFKLKQYKTGGLANFTGPAWLDGTKSKPEYILSADQTKAFFTLVDVLSSLRNTETKPSQNSGDNIYDIDINVENISSDYEVEQLANTIKRLINEDARYRNNNTISLMR